MDQIRIGKYIAEKRKTLNLTQAQLAEQLGMSDKSVSKWERGVCLPDVSVYKPLCDVLGISLNEFLAGEDIPEEIIAPRSENNIIQIIKEHKVNKQKMKRIIAVLTVVVVAVSSLMIHMLIKDGKFLLNYIMPLPEDSPEIAIAEMVAGSDTYLYEFNVEDKYNHIKVNLHTYHKGKLAGTRTISDDVFYSGYDGRGMLAVSVNAETNAVRTIVSGSGYSTFNDTELLRDFNGEWFARSWDKPEEESRIDVSSEAGILAISCDLDGMMSSVSFEIQENGFWPKGKEYCPELENNDYTFFFTVEFGTKELQE